MKPVYDSLGYRLPAVNDQAPEMVSMFTRNRRPIITGGTGGRASSPAASGGRSRSEPWSGARLDDVQVFQEHLDGTAAQLTVKARVQAARAGHARVEVTLPDEPGTTPAAIDVPVKAGISDVSVPLWIDKPERWWPERSRRAASLHGGDAPVLDGVARAVRRTKIGLRTIEVVHRRDDEGGKPGKSFTIRVNGAPVFMKGANWVPRRQLPASA